VIPLVDAFGREHTYLRVSVTDRCNFRCVYCMPEEGLSWMPRTEVLSYEEIASVVRVMAGMGVTKIRLTGGEPTMRSDITELISAIHAIDGISDIAMTTNAHTLTKMAASLAQAGLNRVNISLDTLDPDRFGALTRGGDVHRVLAGIEAAREHGITPIRINAVILAGENEDDIFDLVEHFQPHADNTEVRFIEYMPFQVRLHQTVPGRTLRSRLQARFDLQPVTRSDPSAGPAAYWRIGENGLRVGFISPLSEHFCASCNRLRLMLDGHLRTCLAHEDTPSLRDLIRRGATAEQLEVAIRAMVMGKPVGHACEIDGEAVFEGVMTAIGG
jgi:cyclic pyranopterin phosphate synthase